jgi:hypothetical protein
MSPQMSHEIGDAFGPQAGENVHHRREILLQNLHGCIVEQGAVTRFPERQLERRLLQLPPQAAIPPPQEPQDAQRAGGPQPKPWQPRVAWRRDRSLRPPWRTCRLRCGADGGESTGPDRGPDQAHTFPKQHAGKIAGQPGQCNSAVRPEDTGRHLSRDAGRRPWIGRCAIAGIGRWTWQEFGVWNWVSHDRHPSCHRR